MAQHGLNFVGFDLLDGSGKTFQGYNPKRSATTTAVFHEASPEQIDAALALAEKASAHLGSLSGETIAKLLLRVREEVAALGEQLIETADEESALGVDRLRGERDRTLNQITMFADMAREGSWVDARIDTALAERKPLPRPDIRRMLQPVGPVVVFGASNFPLAFSIAGGDTISALAARNPVLAKAHPAHPATSELVAGAVVRAVRRESLPEGTFSMLHGLSPEVSLQLVTDPRTKAVAFTGSHRAGRALFDAAAKRPEPIPVFAEMGSVNPVFVLPSALRNAPEQTADGLFRSVMLGVGQFCTCPGIVFGVAGSGWTTFLRQLTAQFKGAKPGTMLNRMIAQGYADGLKRARSVEGVDSALSDEEGSAERTEGRPGVLITDADTWLEHKELREEIFGPATVAVTCRSEGDLLKCSHSLEGSLTATVHGSAEDLAGHCDLIATLRDKAGRLIFNGYPTGVEVGYAMQHGGPYPATTDARFTSVGAGAILRFARPVCFQNFPDGALPAELRNGNPLGIWRTVNGQVTRNPL